MKLRKVVMCLAVLMLCVTAYAAMTNSATAIKWNSISAIEEGGPLDKFCDELETYAEGTAAANTLANVEVFDSNDTLTAAETGKVCVSLGHATTAANVIFTLPTASAGLTFTFVDASTTAADDVWITAGAGDTINGGTAAKSLKCITDAVGQSVTLTAVNGTKWEITASVGTWANDNS